MKIMFILLFTFSSTFSVIINHKHPDETGSKCENKFKNTYCPLKMDM